ncbi:hypothetical protein BDW67DRAFT_115766 [Aspergillus spinulosporus]
MAPVPYRPPPTPLIQQRPLIAPSFTPFQPTSFIPWKLFLQLLAGTVCIFILTVLIWKFPRLLRSFTKGRILREGNTTSSRYAKTWYGWVSLQRHEARKRVVRDYMAKIHSWSPWRSSKADFEWIWRYSEQKELSTYQERGKHQLSWPVFHGHETIGSIWSHCSPSIAEPLTIRGLETASPPIATGALPTPHTPRPMATPVRATRTDIPICEGYGNNSLPGYSTVRQLQRDRIGRGFRSDTSTHELPYIGKSFTSLSKLSFPRISRRVPLGYLNHTQPSPHSFSMPCLPQAEQSPPYRYAHSTVTTRSGRTGSADIPSDIYLTFRRSRKYQVWSARMGLQTLKCLGYSTHTLPRGPPGSPKSAVLGSLSLDAAASEIVHQYRQRPKWTSSSDISDLFLYGSDQQYNSRLPVSLPEHRTEGSVQKEWHSLPLQRSPLAPLHRPTLITWYENSLADLQTSITKPEIENKQSSSQRRNLLNPGKIPHRLTQPKNWSNWEVRLIENLDRRLGWIEGQLTPGQRPFHFALLANHWLNRDTWIVFDPVSRVDTDRRRLWGDPRFNVPYPMPSSVPTAKYPKSTRQPAHTPKINSWRVAVNQQRKASGQKVFLHSIEHYDSSVEDPPDGHIDPASWVLRRPPQGFGLSSRQGERYYEGGAGWQEKLSDWQKIKRGYRIRKAIFEGRVNRRRAKELVYGIARYYRYTTKLLKSDSGHCQVGSWELSIDELS